MTRQDYQAIAKMLNTEKQYALTLESDTKVALARTQTLRTVTYQLAQIFKRDNSRFKPDLFFEAAGFLELTGMEVVV